MISPPFFHVPLWREGVERLGRAERIAAGVWKTYDRGTEDDPSLIILPTGILKVDALVARWLWDSAAPLRGFMRLQRICPLELELDSRQKRSIEHGWA
jgi:hypothetical protein